MGALGVVLDRIMKNSLRVNYQRQLIYAGLDDFSPNSVFPDYLGGEFGEDPFLWSLEVANFLDLGVRHGLLEVMNWEYLFSDSPLVSVSEVLLPRYPSGGRAVQMEIIWNSLYFTGTVSLLDELDRFGFRVWSALSASENLEFLQCIQRRYQFELGL